MPPLSALRAFEAYATQGSLQKAGDALNVSHAAVSQQIRNLEAHLSVTLLDRSGRQAQLTREGRDMADVLSASFGAIGAEARKLTTKMPTVRLLFRPHPALLRIGWCLFGQFSAATPRNQHCHRCESDCV